MAFKKSCALNKSSLSIGRVKAKQYSIDFGQKQSQYWKGQVCFVCHQNQSPDWSSIVPLQLLLSIALKGQTLPPVIPAPFRKLYAAVLRNDRPLFDQ